MQKLEKKKDFTIKKKGGRKVMAKRKAPKMTKEIMQKIVSNPRTPKGLKGYWKKRLAALK